MEKNLKNIETFTLNKSHFASYNGSSEIISLKEIGFEKTDLDYIKPELNSQIIESYGNTGTFLQWIIPLILV
jgi:deoxyribodipyrimidine photo-lyase